MENKDFSFSIAADHSYNISILEKVGLTIVGFGLLLLFLGLFGIGLEQSGLMLTASLLAIFVGTVLYAQQKYLHRPEGIKNNGNYFAGLTNQGVLAWIAGIVVTGFYVLLYFYPKYLGLGADGAANSGLVRMFDPLSFLLKGTAASQWFVYGTLYTVAILALGIKFIWKYRHNKYQIVRTLSVMFFQLGFAFLIPELLEGLNPDKAYFAKDIKNMWPLNYYFFEDWHLKNMLAGGGMGMFMLLLGLAMIFVISPVLTYFYGKRWYCSWVCGCGGLAETAGDSFRHLSNNSLTAWKIERWMIHAVLALIIFVTALVLYSYYTGQSQIGFLNTYDLRKWYGFGIGSVFSGVIGVGFYPILGSRVWCRFGCPMAAILGLQQRFFSRFRITTNGDQCISCGNCSTYCEMGIDVRWYAQRGQDIVRASCVGCGVCSAVCPRGVLKLENGPTDSRKIINIDEYGINIKP